VNGLFKAQLIYVGSLACLLILTLAIQPLGPSDGWM
jgi:hypothetical protein